MPATARPTTTDDAARRIALVQLREAIDAELSRRRAEADLEPAGDLPVRIEELSSISADLGGLARLALGAARAGTQVSPTKVASWLRTAAQGVDTWTALRRRASQGVPMVDDFGFDREWTESLVMPALRFLYRDWWRISVRGGKNIPADGAALLISNHAGVIPYDGVMVRMAAFDATAPHRHARALVLDSLLKSPFAGNLMRRTGNTLAVESDALQLLKRGELVLVFPEGSKGAGKLYRERYRLRRFGRGGFAELALRTGVPIVPVSVVGSEEIHPMLANLGWLARTLNQPYVPITPTLPLLGPLGAIPLPSTWIIEFHAPIPVAKAAGPVGPEEVLALSDRVRNTIQDGVYANLQRRGSVFAEKA